MHMRTYTASAAQRDRKNINSAFWNGFFFGVGLAALIAVFAVYTIASINLGA